MIKVNAQRLSLGMQEIDWWGFLLLVIIIVLANWIRGRFKK